MDTEQYETAKNLFLANLKASVENRHAIERDTVLQAESALWLELRRCLLTASSFSKVYSVLKKVNVSHVCLSSKCTRIKLFSMFLTFARDGSI
jgi:hypothetical protein